MVTSTAICSVDNDAGYTILRERLYEWHIPSAGEVNFSNCTSFRMKRVRNVVSRRYDSLERHVKFDARLLKELSRAEPTNESPLREVHVVFFTTCGNICGVFHHKSKSPQVQITTSTCGDIVHGWVKGQGAQHKWGKHVR